MSTAFVWDCDSSGPIAVCRQPEKNPHLRASSTIAEFGIEVEHLEWRRWKVGRVTVEAAFDAQEARLYVAGRKTPARARLAGEIRAELIDDQRRATLRVVR